MAYRLKYELHGQSVPFGKNWKVRISQDGYLGDPIDRNVPSNPFTLKKDSAGTIRGTSLDFAIRAISDFEFIDLYTNNSRDWLIELVDTNDVVIWQGYILPEEYQEPYSPAPVTVGFTATDQLGLLKNYTYTHNPAVTSQTLLSTLKECLENTGLSLGFAISVSITEANLTIDEPFLAQISHNPASFDGMTCYNVVSDIVSRCDGEITQNKGLWLIRSSIDKLSDRYIYDSSLVYIDKISGIAVQNMGPFGSSDIWPTGSPLSMTLATAERVMSISENYGTKNSILPPQDNLSWTNDNTLPGWVGVTAAIERVNIEIPYILVKQADLTNDYDQYANTLVPILKTTANSIRFSFEFAYIAQYISLPTSGLIIGDGQPYAKISVMVDLYDPILNQHWYLSKKFGWTRTLSRLEIPNTQAAGGKNITPNWGKFNVYADGIPVNGGLTVYLFAPIQDSFTTARTIWGAGFQNVSFVILEDNKLLPPGIDYQINLNNSTKATKKEYKWVGGDVPATDNAKIQFKSFWTLPSGALTGQWITPDITTPVLLIELIGKLYASRNRKASQYLTGSIRGENIDFDTIIQHDYPTPRKFEIIEATYSLCQDKAVVTLVEILDYANVSYTETISDSSSNTETPSSSGAGGSGSKTIEVISPDYFKAMLPFDAEQFPTIPYALHYAETFGRYPTLRLFTIDPDGNYIERNEKSKLIMVDGVIDSITYDLAVPETGYIIIS